MKTLFIRTPRVNVNLRLVDFAAGHRKDLTGAIHTPVCMRIAREQAPPSGPMVLGRQVACVFYCC